MKKKLFQFIVLLIMTNLTMNAQVKIIPQPRHIICSEGKFGLKPGITIFYDENMLQNALYLSGFLENIGCSAGIMTIGKQNVANSIVLIKNKLYIDSLGEEGYILEINSHQVIIEANTNTGVFWGIQTLMQLLYPEIVDKSSNNQCNLTLPCLNITDFPAFQWRGLLLDCSRHYMDIDFIKKYIDLLAFYKMNRFHWHLTDDQGWRIEIKKYPLLTKIGAWRNENNRIYGGFYSQEDIKEIVMYASERHVMIIPEIEMPGHSLAALAAYPQFSCTKGPFEVEYNWGVFADVYCAGNDSTFAFIEDVLSEVVNLFPSPYIHIGGDEVPALRWNTCKKCKSRMKKLKLSETSQLQSWFIGRISDFLKTKNKRIICWDEIVEGGLPAEAIVQSWRGYEGALKAASTGSDAIVSPTEFAYFDYTLRTTPLDKVYSFTPFPENLNEDLKKHILGGECNMWTEYAPQDKVDSKVFPRLIAMAEVLWTDTDKRNIDDFLNRLEMHYKYLDNFNVNYGYEREPVEFMSAYDEREKYMMISFVPGQKNLNFYYTTDGSQPDKNSLHYSGAFILRNSANIKVRIYRNDKPDDNIYSRNYQIHNGVGREITITYPPHTKYTAGGDKGLLDGVMGSENYYDGLWMGFKKEDMEAIIKLYPGMKFNKIKVRFMQSSSFRIFFPEFVELCVSDDGRIFKPVSQLSRLNKNQDDPQIRIEEFIFSELDDLKTGYIKIIARNIRFCPDWHEGAGEDAWIFTDEIIFE